MRKSKSTLRHDGPSKASLREMPEADFSKVKLRRGFYAKRYAEETNTVHVTRGRPKKGTETGPTEPRSVRFPAHVWRRLEAKAKKEGLTLHAALRAAVLAWST